MTDALASLALGNLFGFLCIGLVIVSCCAIVFDDRRRATMWVTALLVGVAPLVLFLWAASTIGS